MNHSICCGKWLITTGNGIMYVYGIPYVSVFSQRQTRSLSWLAAMKEWQGGGITATECFKVIGQMTGQDDDICLLVPWHTNTHILCTNKNKEHHLLQSISHFFKGISSPLRISMFFCCFICNCQNTEMSIQLFIGDNLRSCCNRYCIKMTRFCVHPPAVCSWIRCFSVWGLQSLRLNWSQHLVVVCRYQAGQLQLTSVWSLQL